MKTKREVLEAIAKSGHCDCIQCSYCPYGDHPRHCPDSDLLKRVGAIAILKRFPEKREFDTDKILTCVTADKAKVGMKGYFGDDLVQLKINFKDKTIRELEEVYGEHCSCRFAAKNGKYALFYPIEEVKNDK